MLAYTIHAVSPSSRVQLPSQFTVDSEVNAKGYAVITANWIEATQFD
jgi:hypothetical protein